MAVIQLGSACACQRIRKDKCSVGEWVRDNPQRGVLMVALVTLNLCHHIRHPSKRQVGETEAVHCGHMKKKPEFTATENATLVHVMTNS